MAIEKNIRIDLWEGDSYTLECPICKVKSSAHKHPSTFLNFSCRHFKNSVWDDGRLTAYKEIQKLDKDTTNKLFVTFTSYVKDGDTTKTEIYTEKIYYFFTNDKWLAFEAREREERKPKASDFDCKYIEVDEWEIQQNCWYSQWREEIVEEFGGGWFVEVESNSDYSQYGDNIAYRDHMREGWENFVAENKCKHFIATGGHDSWAMLIKVADKRGRKLKAYDLVVEQLSELNNYPVFDDEALTRKEEEYTLANLIDNMFLWNFGDIDPTDDDIERMFYMLYSEDEIFDHLHSGYLPDEMVDTGLKLLGYEHEDDGNRGTWWLNGIPEPTPEPEPEIVFEGEHFYVLGVMNCWGNMNYTVTT
jgi:hypothetical protein